MGAAAGYRGSLAWQASTERAELQKISQKLDVLKRESRSVLHASGISTEELEASINKQANVTEDELTWCAIVFAFHIIPLVAPIGTYVVKDAWVSARKVNPLPFVQGCYKLLESFNWRKLLELIRSRQLDMVSFALLLTAANTVNFFSGTKRSFAEKKSDVGKLLRDIAAFLEDIEKREIFH
ncbi:hypothetical protein BaRGS_00028222 [Batillaria attramentaria]|uniref:Uncharacterized protein n=1 Tax=Batillaria attramentaria TaxID=370345 RepID=A0ABD0JZM0_9CAEN